MGVSLVGYVFCAGQVFYELGARHEVINAVVKVFSKVFFEVDFLVEHVQGRGFCFEDGVEVS